MKYANADRQLQRQHPRPAGSPAMSQHGFQPAFQDSGTGRIYLSLTFDGQPAPIHLPDSLPDHLVESWDQAGRVVALRPQVTHGYVQGDKFYTREEAYMELVARLKPQQLP